MLPNPFDPSIAPAELTLNVGAVELPGASSGQFDFTAKVTWEIVSPYTATLERVVTANQAITQPGTYGTTLTWDGKSSASFESPDGVYQYRAVAEVVRTKRKDGKTKIVDTAASAWRDVIVERAEPLEPVLLPYHADRTDPWIEYWALTNVCQEMMCDPWDDICTGSAAAEEFIVQPRGKPRNRYMFFEACPGCSEAPSFARPGTYRTAGGYRYVDGEGTSEKLAPFGSEASVGHVRYYDRGLCSYETDALVGIKDELAAKLRSWILDDWHMADVSILGKEMRAYLGSSECSTSFDYFAESTDYLHVRIELKVWPLALGFWKHTIDAWWRFTAGKRSELLFCPSHPVYGLTSPCSSDADCHGNGGINPFCNSDGICTIQCENDHQCAGYPNANQCGGDAYFHTCMLKPNECHTLTCSDDTFCELLVPGSFCGANHQCTKESFLDVADFGVESHYVRGCGGGDDNHDLPVVDLLCKAYFEGYKQAVAKYTANPYKIFALVIDQMYGQFWQDSGDLFPCTGEEPAFCTNIFGPYGFDARCPDGDDVNCEVRPYLVRGVNLLPASVEFVFASSKDDDTYVLLNQVRMCEEGPAESLWSQILGSWWE